MGSLAKNKNVRLIGHAVAAYYTGGASLTASAYIEQGIQQKADYKEQAEAEQFNAKNREIDRKRNLLKALAWQNVKGASSGTFGGKGSSQDAMMREDISLKGFDTITDRGRTSQRVSGLQQRGQSAQTGSLINAASAGSESYQRSNRRGSVR